MPEEFYKSFILMFVLLNPFSLSVYLLDLVRDLNIKEFSSVLIRASFISGAAYITFALTGDAIFKDLLQVRFAAFLLFGGIVFLILGLRYVFNGSEALVELRGSPEHLAGSVALPFMIGPGTVSASVLAGSQLEPMFAILAIVLALGLSDISLILLKYLHDYVKTRNEPLVERYIDIVGRISALVVGTIAVEMILQGIELWLKIHIT